LARPLGFADDNALRTAALCGPQRFAGGNAPVTCITDKILPMCSGEIFTGTQGHNQMIRDDPLKSAVACDRLMNLQANPTLRAAQAHCSNPQGFNPQGFNPQGFTPKTTAQ
jgi:hypothetical protein